MINDLDLFGVYVPGALVLACLAFALQLVLRRLLAWAGAYRLVWHPAPFDVALFVILLSGLAALTQRFVS
ncbi:DUF1656 domain-containing protein [Labrys wisconsinensis]|uniref:DUF1656 domain-containing protein n=1 Tax=Labrys wisconsinensis TaxID=425677 RepID=A0ABU0J1G5_9HYPH|nr:DUF1656 domain-containing protein [Labrys wisconsinensis]MDQ0467416.1 hypothetical protein [Labrys wisconsinensis]